jgi:Uma2 family endonuclease
MTAEDYMALPDSFDGPTELVKGVLVAMPPARPRHGQLCARIVYLLQRYLESHDVGHVVSNDSGTVTQRDPDTVRGPDVSYYSYKQVPKGPLPDGLLAVSPELVFEVRSPSDRWSEIHVKVGEYLRVNVRAVCVLDDDTKCIHTYFAEREPQILSEDDELTLPDILDDFRVKIARFFE